MKITTLVQLLYYNAWKTTGYESRKRSVHSSLTYLGHTIDSHGIHTLSDRVEAVKKAPIPTNLSQLRSFLGTINYYGSFIPQLSSKLAPLNNLLISDVEQSWPSEADKAFKNNKQYLYVEPVLIHYDPLISLVVACNSSSVLAQCCHTNMQTELNDQLYMPFAH